MAEEAAEAVEEWLAKATSNEITSLALGQEIYKSVEQFVLI